MLRVRELFVTTLCQNYWLAIACYTTYMMLVTSIYIGSWSCIIKQSSKANTKNVRHNFVNNSRLLHNSLQIIGVHNVLYFSSSCM